MHSASTDLRSAVRNFSFPNVSPLEEHILGPTESEAPGEISYRVGLFVGLKPNSYSDGFTFWADCLRCYAETCDGRIMSADAWHALAGSLSCFQADPDGVLARAR